MVSSNGTGADTFKRGEWPFGKGPVTMQARPASGLGDVSKGWNDIWADSGSAFLSPQLGGREELTRPYEENATLHACLVVKSKAIRQAVLRLYPDDTEDADPVEDHELLDLFKRPNALQSGKMLAATTYALLKLDGEVYWFFQDKGTGEPVKVGATGIDFPTQIWPVRKRLVKRTEGGLRYRIKGKAGAETWSHEHPEGTTLRFYDFDPENMSGGLGDVESLARQLAIQFQIERGTEGVVRNNGDPGGFISVQGSLGAETRARLQEKSDDEWNKPENRGRRKVLDKGATYTPNPWTPKDMEFGAAQRRIDEKISGVLGVPLPLIGVLENSTYNNLSEAKRDLWTGGNGVLSDLEYLVEFLNTFFFPSLADPKASKFVAYFDTSAVKELQDDQSARYTAAVTGVATGIGQTWNEAARMVGLEMSEPPANADEPVTNPALFAPTQPEPGAAGDPQPLDLDAGGPSLTVLTNASNIISIARDVSAGALTRETGLGLLQGLFGMTSEEAATTLGPAGTGKVTEPDEPEPGPTPPGLVGTAGDPNAKPDPNAEPPIPPKSHIFKVSTGDYYKAFEEAVLFPNDKAIKTAARRFLQSYKDAQTKRLEAFARDGFDAKGFDLDRSRMEGRKADSLNLTPDELESLLLGRAEWAGKFRKLMDKPLFEAYVRALRNAVEEVGGIALAVEDPRVVAALSQQAIKLTEGVTSNLAEGVRKKLLEAVTSAPQSVGSLQEVVRDLLVEMKAGVTNAFPNIEARAEAIARTESAHAANSARFEQFKASEVVQRHQWIDSGDSATRLSHLRVGTMGPGGGGEIVEVGNSFSNGLRFPLDPLGSASEVVNCRCTTRPVIA